MMNRSDDRRSLVMSILAAAFVVTVSTSGAHATSCGSGTYPFPFTDVGGVNDAFCLGIMEAYVLGVTRGTTATTFSPNDSVPRLQMTTFLQRSIDQGLRRNSRRMALGQWWTPKTAAGLQKINLIGAGPAGFCKADGEQIWVGNGAYVHTVQARTGMVQDDFDMTGAPFVAGVLTANGHVYASDGVSPRLVVFRPFPPDVFAAEIHTVSYHPNNLAFDGDRIWTANFTDGSISIISVVSGVPLSSSATIVGGFTSPIDVIFDGSNVWVAESSGANRLRKLNSNGTIAQTVAVGTQPAYMAYDGANIWVPNFAGNSLTVVQASTGAVVATIATNAANRLSAPLQAAFDGERILVTNSGNDSATLFRAADLSLIGNVQFAAGSQPFGACSDGINFWVTLRGTKELLRL